MSEFGVIGKKWCGGGEDSIKGAGVDGRGGAISSIMPPCFNNKCIL